MARSTWHTVRVRFYPGAGSPSKRPKEGQNSGEHSEKLHGEQCLCLELQWIVCQAAWIRFDPKLWTKWSTLDHRASFGPRGKRGKRGKQRAAKRHSDPSGTFSIPQLTPETSDVSSLIHPLVKLSRHNVTQVWHSEAHRLYKSNHLSSCFLFTYHLPSGKLTVYYGKSPLFMGSHQLFNN